MATHNHLQYAILHEQSITARWDLPVDLGFVDDVGVIDVLSRQKSRHLVAVLSGVTLRKLPGSDCSDYRVRRLDPARRITADRVQEKVRQHQEKGYKIVTMAMTMRTQVEETLLLTESLLPMESLLATIATKTTRAREEERVPSCGAIQGNRRQVLSQ